MRNYTLEQLRDTSWASICMWTWFIASTIGAGVLFGNAFRTGYRDDFNAGAMFGGFIVGAIGCLPVIAIFNVLVRILHSQHSLHVPRPAPKRAKEAAQTKPPAPTTATAADTKTDTSTPTQRPTPSTTPPGPLPPRPGGGGRGTAPRPSDRRWGRPQQPPRQSDRRWNSGA